MNGHADSEHPRRVLLAVTGLSPQVVTETLYALAVERAWTPTEIQIITTRRGAEEVRQTLLSEEPGWFHRLRQEYRLPEIKFGIDSVHVITALDECPLDDIVDEDANVAVADFITEKVRAITADTAASLHVSIAGGRKTMGFYIGYALSLFGRPQDQLSHVLIPPPFESLPDFFYPPPQSRLIRDCDGQVLDARNAEVYLGVIPFVRLRDHLPKWLQDGGARFSEAVAEAQKALPVLSLRLDPTTKTVVAGGKALALQPMQFALYWMLAERRRAERGGLSRKDAQIGQELLNYYGRLVNPHSGQYERAERAHQRSSADNFDQTKAKLNRALTRALGELVAPPYLVVGLDTIEQTRLQRYGLSLPPETITIATASLPPQPVRPSTRK
jgi:CRISPR-associated protein (TIGR02584 family)